MDAKITLKIYMKSHIKTTPTCLGTHTTALPYKKSLTFSNEPT
jgi:hypothetical protein